MRSNVLMSEPESDADIGHVERLDVPESGRSLKLLYSTPIVNMMYTKAIRSDYFSILALFNSIVPILGVVFIDSINLARVIETKGCENRSHKSFA